jgi:hypothetical protein
MKVTAKSARLASRGWERRIDCLRSYKNTACAILALFSARKPAILCAGKCFADTH